MMIRTKHNSGGILGCVREYECDPETEIELCFANLECLLKIALSDSDAHIKELGGEQELLNLMNGYLDLAERLKSWKALDVGKHLYLESITGLQLDDGK